ncbi:MAG: hypothetical protein LBU48_06805 [Coriobacteriales bacterium]|jgi:hypothetical protein|nr:hypothetical protein [Coriobacteriales bacterium]
MLGIPTKILLLIAGAAWLIAGAAVTSTGIAASQASWTNDMLIGLLIVFMFFAVMFLMVSRKHKKRILGYTEQLTSILRFFDAGSYIIMAVMIGLGVAVRLSGLVPDPIIAFFYTGLGSALLLSAVYYLVTFLTVWDGFPFSAEKDVPTAAPAWLAPLWIVLIVVAVSVEFCGRLFGLEGNPTGIHHTWAPILTSCLSVLMLLFGYFTALHGRQKHLSLRLRNGALIFTTGLLMLATSFIFRMAIPLIFG